jgi:predicted nucleotidyltransferase component of viral defense system
MKELHWQTVEESTKFLLLELSILLKEQELTFKLAGGTNLALRIGHRKSIDLDFFCLEPFNNEDILEILKQRYRINILHTNKNSIQLLVNEIKVDFLRHNYIEIEPVEIIEDVPMYSFADISAFKLNAIMNRGSKKDFWDIYFIIQIIGVKNLFDNFEMKYGGNYDLTALIRSILYFGDAEKDIDPFTLIPVSWDEVKRYIRHEVSGIL